MAVVDRQDIAIALASLTLRQRAVLVLRYYDGLSEAEIAEVLGIRPGSVKGHARAGLSALGAQLRRPGVEGGIVMSLEDLVERALTDKARDMSAAPDVEALVARGTQARRRRRLAIVASIVAMVLIGAVAVGPMLRDTAGPAPVSGMPSPPASIERDRDGRTADGAPVLRRLGPDVPVTFTMPVGWEASSAFVVKSGADPALRVGVHRCRQHLRRWVPMGAASTRRPGPTVDDLVSAYAKLPGFGASAARRCHRRRVPGEADSVHGPRIRAEHLPGRHIRPSAGRQRGHEHRPGWGSELLGPGPEPAEPGVHPRRGRHPARDLHRVPPTSRRRTEPTWRPSSAPSRSAEPVRGLTEPDAASRASIQ